MTKASTEALKQEIQKLRTELRQCDDREKRAKAHKNTRQNATQTHLGLGLGLGLGKAHKNTRQNATQTLTP